MDIPGSVINLLVIFGLMAFVAVVYFYSKYWQVAHLRDLEKVAQELGLRFNTEENMGENEALLKHLEKFYLSTWGVRREITRVMYGRYRGRQIRIFEHRYFTVGLKGSATIAQTVFYTEFGGNHLPAFELLIEALGDKLATWQGLAQDINFEDDRLFSGRFLLHGNEEDEVRKVFTEPVRQFYLGHGNLCTECDGKQIIFYYPGRLCAAKELRAFLDDCMQVLDLFHLPVEF